MSRADPLGPPESVGVAVGDAQLYALATLLRLVEEVVGVAGGGGGGASPGPSRPGPDAGDGDAPAGPDPRPPAVCWRDCGLFRAEVLGDVSRALVRFGGALPGPRSGEGWGDAEAAEARLLCCRAWHGVASILDLDMGSGEDAPSGRGMRPGLLHDAARQLVIWALSGVRGPHRPGSLDLEN